MLRRSYAPEQPAAKHHRHAQPERKTSPTHTSGGDKNDTEYENQQGEDVTEFAHTQAIMKSQKR